MDFFIVILIIIIILLILYLYYKNYQYNKSLESFDNTTQSALSTYFQNTIDADSYATDKNKYHSITVSNSKNKQWNGIWKNVDYNIYAQFIQNNDVLIMALSNSYINSLSTVPTSTDPPPSSANEIANITCYKTNSYIGKCKLSKDYLNFVLIKTICDTNHNLGSVLNLTPYNLTGVYSVKNTVKTITLTDNNNKSVELSYFPGYTYPTNNYIESLNKNINQYPEIPDSSFSYRENICQSDDKPCKVPGIATYKTREGKEYNACGRVISATDNTCNPATCYFYGSTNLCSPVSYQVYDYMNFAPLTVQSNYLNNNLTLCNNLKYFGQYNTWILCYITNICNAYTLNYQFFGSLSDESSLTVQADIMNQMLNDTIPATSTNPIKTGLLKYYRTIIKDTNAVPSSTVENGNNFPANNILNALSLINCDSSVNTCRTKCAEYIDNQCCQNSDDNQCVKSIGNKELYPCIWQIDASSNVLNSCSIILSTSALYTDTPKKYAEFNDDGTTNLSLYKGGLKQELSLDQTWLIDMSSFGYVYLTTNLITNNGLYLIPSMDNSGFNGNANIVKLENQPSNNGKWLLIGCTLNSMNDLTPNLPTLCGLGDRINL